MEALSGGEWKGKVNETDCILSGKAGWMDTHDKVGVRTCKIGFERIGKRFVGIKTTLSAPSTRTSFHRLQRRYMAVVDVVVVAVILWLAELQD